MQRDTHLGILSPLNMLEACRWPTIVDLLCSVYPDIAPERYGRYEPLREKFDPAHPDEFISLMSHAVHWKRRSPRSEGSWFPGTRHRSLHADISISIDAARTNRACGAGTLRVRTGQTLSGQLYFPLRGRM